MKHIKKILSYSIAGSLGLTVIASLEGCDQNPQPNGRGGFDASQEYDLNQNFFLVMKQTGVAPDTYELVEKHPTDGPTRAILRDMEGNERFMSEDELRQIAETEAARVEEGTSRLTQDPAMQSGGLSLGETIMAAAVGSLVGGMIANRLMGNRNFQRNTQTYGRPASSISRSAGRMGKGVPNSLQAKQKPRSGFFGGTRSSSGSRSSYGTFGG